MLRIAVIGAGVVGLSSALNVQMTFPNAKVTIIADQFGSETVSYGSGGFFHPQAKNFERSDNAKLMKQCLRDSWKHYSGLAMSEKAKESGYMLISGWSVHNTPNERNLEILKECTFDFHQVPVGELQRRGVPFKYGYACITVICQPPIYMEWLMKQFKLKGGEVQRRTVNRIEELYGDYDLVVNCCGLRALTFLGDKECKPVRGQLVMVKAPWIKQFYISDQDVYLIPHHDKVLVGGIRIDGDSSTEVVPHVSDDIIKKAEAVFPELKGAERLYSWAGSRPGRSQVRLEIEVVDAGDNRRLPVIHNYGHGANGVALSWGTGIHVAKLVIQSFPFGRKSSL